MDEPDWAKVLSVLYAEEDSVYREMKGELSESHNLVKETGLETARVEGALAFLRDQGLIETDSAGHRVTEGGNEVTSTHIEYQLSEKGFDVAHERDLKKDQQASNWITTALTLVLAASAALSFGWNVYIQAGVGDVVSPEIVGVILLVIFLAALTLVRRFIRIGFDI